MRPPTSASRTASPPPTSTSSTASPASLSACDSIASRPASCAVWVPFQSIQSCSPRSSSHIFQVTKRSCVRSSMKSSSHIGTMSPSLIVLLDGSGLSQILLSSRYPRV
ncbi:hypothetical protein PVAP13_4KG059181 [Panicum virgatum]|uniref:Uncharacterized protein n=1 Tax=Panicum virgatum TaxID=38727 RepID=A0A8T0TD83_PANVG|nr:hypothetical protein PVAP13_4KG059181 [Panicum virgatum]